MALVMVYCIYRLYTVSSHLANSQVWEEGSGSVLLSVSPHHPVPLYQQIVEQIRTKILGGELRPEDPLPSIRELARELTTSVITTKRAYLELEKEGLIVTRPGLGTFVARVTPEKLQELKRARVKEQLRAAVREARQVGMNKQELQEMLEDVLTE